MNCAIIISTSLTQFFAGLGRLKGIAGELNDEVRLQSVMIDEIIAKVRLVPFYLPHCLKSFASCT